MVAPRALLWQDRVGKKPSVKADLAIYSYVITVPVRVDTILNGFQLL